MMLSKSTHALHDICTGKNPATTPSGEPAEQSRDTVFTDHKKGPATESCEALQASEPEKSSVNVRASWVQTRSMYPVFNMCRR